MSAQLMCPAKMAAAGPSLRTQAPAFKQTLLPMRRPAVRQLRQWRAASAGEGEPAPAAPSGADLQLDEDSEMARKKAAADALRDQEKFMTIGTGEAECQGCGYTYDPRKGDPDYPIAPGMKFEDVPGDWLCPVCGAEKRLFKSKQKEVAGFAANQGYGLGTNSMTGEQKSLLIYGALAAFFALFLLGYTLE